MTRPIHEQGIQKWIESILLPLSIDPVIFANEEGVRPTPPFSEILILSDDSVHQPEKRTVYDSEEDEVTNQIRLTRSGSVDISIFGEGHRTGPFELIASKADQETQDLLWQYGLSIIGGTIIYLGTDSDDVTNNQSVTSFLFSWAHVSSKTTSEFIENPILTGNITNG